MSNLPNVWTFRDPAFSLWQSTIHAALKNHPVHAKTILAAGQPGVAATAGNDYMLAAVQAMQELQAPVASAPIAAHSAGPISTIAECAKLAAQIAWAELFDHAKVPGLKSQLTFGGCDPFWAECITLYEGFLASRKTQPYTIYSDIGDYVLTNPSIDTGKIAVIGDWGTGMGDALVLLQQIASNFHPQVLIHLGDIYYSGLPSEDSDHFVSIINQVWPQDPPLVFTLDGNHDRYAGAAGGYYTLIANLNKSSNLPQPNSYFALRNNFWQFVAMDTGYHDTNPFTVNSNLTYLEQTEIDWHLDKIRNNGAGVDNVCQPKRSSRNDCAFPPPALLCSRRWREREWRSTGGQSNLGQRFRAGIPANRLLALGPRTRSVHIQAIYYGPWSNTSTGTLHRSKRCSCLYARSASRETRDTPVGIRTPTSGSGYHTGSERRRFESRLCNHHTRKGGTHDRLLSNRQLRRHAW